MGNSARNIYSALRAIRETYKATALAGALLFGFLAAGCATNLNSVPQAGQVTGQVPATPPVSTDRKSPVTVAMLLPLQGFGTNALIAKGMKQAGEMALFDADNPNVQLIVKNDDGSAAGAQKAAMEALSDGAELIVGPLYGASVPGVAAIARSANVPVLSFSNNRSVGGNGVYLMSYLPQAEVERMVSFCLSRGKRRFAALIPVGAYGDAVELAFRSAVLRGGGTIVALERFEPGANKMLEPASRVFSVVNEAAGTGAPVDALFLPGNKDTLPTLGPQIAYAKIDTRTTQLVGLSGWNYPHIGRDDVFVGGWYPGPDPRGWQRFSERFANTFGSVPPRMASHAYDAVRLAITLSGQPKGQRFTQANLTLPRGFDGVDGSFTLLADGTSQRELAVFEVQKFGGKVIGDAAQAGLANPAAGGRSQQYQNRLYGGQSVGAAPL